MLQIVSRIDIIAREYLPASFFLSPLRFFPVSFIIHKTSISLRIGFWNALADVHLILERELTFILEWQFPALRMKKKKENWFSIGV